jgi:hypothetical protein
LFRIDGAEGSKNNQIYNNTIINPSNARWCIINNNGSSGNILLNNIIINHHTYRGSISVDESSSSGFVSNYNLLVDRFSTDGEESNIDFDDWQNLGYDSESEIVLTEELIFADHQNGDYHLLAESQPVNKGTSIVTQIVAHDLDKIPRPQGSGFDIGAYEFTGSTGVDEERNAYNFYLLQNYPNPFNPVTTISWHMERTDHVILKVHDMLGRAIIVLADGESPSGFNRLEFNAGNLSSGTYFYTLSAGEQSITRKLMLLK